jgi:CHAD domain-containing protein
MRAPQGLRIIAAAGLLAAAAMCAHAQGPVRDFTVTDSAAAAYRAALSRLSSPELEHRKAARLVLQRRGYAAILHRSLARDVWGSILAVLKMEGQLDFHLPVNTLVTTIYVQPPGPRKAPSALYEPPSSAPVQIPLLEDRRFPRDPWHK